MKQKRIVIYNNNKGLSSFAQKQKLEKSVQALKDKCDEEERKVDCVFLGVHVVFTLLILEC